MDNAFQGLAEYTPDIEHEFHDKPAFIQLQETFPALADDKHRQAFRAYVEKMWAAPESYMDFYRAYMEFLTPSKKSLKFKRLMDYIKQNPVRSSGRRRKRRRSRRPRRKNSSSSKSGESKSGDKQSSNSGSKSNNRSGNRRSNSRSRGRSRSNRSGGNRNNQSGNKQGS